MKSTKKVILALGSNLGNLRENLLRAVSEISNFSFVVSRSYIYQTPPVGYAEQGDFLNAALAVETEDEPAELLAHCKLLEKKLGRAKTVKNGPREIDVDIIFYEDLKLKSGELEIPHPRWSERDFVVSPLIDLLEAGMFEDDFFAEVKSRLAERVKMFPPFSAF